MIEVSDGAKAQLKNMLAENSADKDAILRLTASDEGQLGLIMDKEMPGDQVVEHEGAKVLLVEEHLASHLSSVSMEVEETPEGPMLTLKQSGCGSCCGGDESGCGEGSCGGSCGSC